MKKNNEKETIKELLNNLADKKNDTTKIEDIIKKLTANDNAIENLIRNLDECDLIKLLRIKSTLENYRELTKFKHSSYFPNIVLYASIMISLIPVVLHFLENKDIYTMLIIGAIFLVIILMTKFVEKFIYREKITGLENNTKVILYLVDFSLEKKDNFKKYIHKKKQKTPVNNTSAEK